MVIQQRRLLALQIGQHLRHRVPVVEMDPDRQGVDEQADHGLDTGQFRRTPGDGGAEHHILAVGQPAEQHTPRCLHQRVHRDAQIRAELVHALRQGGVQFGGELRGTVGFHRLRLRCQLGRFGDPGQRLLPRRQRILDIASRQPGQEIPVRVDLRQG